MSDSGLSEQRPRFAVGECFAVFIDDDDWLFGEVLGLRRDGNYFVRVYCQCEPASSLNVYEDFLLTKITRAELDEAARLGWPCTGAWIDALRRNRMEN